MPTAEFPVIPGSAVKTASEWRVARFWCTQAVTETPPTLCIVRKLVLASMHQSPSQSGSCPSMPVPKEFCVLSAPKLFRDGLVINSF